MFSKALDLNGMATNLRRRLVLLATAATVALAASGASVQQTIAGPITFDLPWQAGTARPWTGGPHGVLIVGGLYQDCLPQDACAASVLPKNRSGLDFGGGGWSVHPVAAGRVVFKGLLPAPLGGIPGFGYGVVVDHGSFQTIYAHMDPTSVSNFKASSVTVSSVLGLTGCSGIVPCSNRSHLHLELRTGMKIGSKGAAFYGSPASWDNRTIGGWLVKADSLNYNGSATKCGTTAWAEVDGTTTFIAGSAGCTSGQAPATPTSTTATALNPTTIRVAWIDNATNEQGFRVSDNVTTYTAGQNPSQGSTYFDFPTQPATYECFHVQAYNGAGSSGWSAGWACTTTPSAASASEMTSPAPGSQLSGPNVTFRWTGGASVSAHWLYVGTSSGAGDLYNSNQLGASQTSQSVFSLPTDGSTLYVRVWSLLPNGWHYNDYTYTAAALAVTYQINRALSNVPSGWQVTLTTMTVATNGQVTLAFLYANTGFYYGSLSCPSDGSPDSMVLPDGSAVGPIDSFCSHNIGSSWSLAPGQSMSDWETYPSLPAGVRTFSLYLGNGFSVRDVTF
jgi:murein DD-endopeptidase MepM/ murein hydrolase activator NlpD